MKFGTKAVHAGVVPDPTTGAIMTPIYQTSTYVQESPAKHKGYAYARGANPTRNALQASIAALENGKYGLCFSSGMGATDAVIKLLNPGDEVITSNDLYGGSYRMFKRVFEKYGIRFHFIDLTKSSNIQPLINSKTKLLWLETPTNPLMNIVDIKACCDLPAVVTMTFHAKMQRLDAPQYKKGILRPRHGATRVHDKGKILI